MKRMRKLLTVMLTAVLVMMMGMSAMATAPTDPDEPNVDIKGSITVTNAIEGETYTLYKVFRATVSDGRIEGQNGISYKSDWTVPENDYFAVDDQGNITIKDAGKDTEGHLTPGAIDWLKRQIGNFRVIGTKEAGADPVVWEDLDPGYYYISTTTGSFISVDSITPDVEVEDKNTLPSHDKKQSDEEEGGFGDDLLELNIGDTVYYQTEISIGKGSDKDIMLTDEMTDGLDLQSTITVKLGDQVVPTTGYTLTKDTHGFVLTLLEDYVITLSDEDVVTVSYSAVINKDAAIDSATGNSNKATLKYSEQTAEDEVFVATYDFILEKTDGSKFLDGSGFKLYDASTGGNQIVVAKDDTGYYVDQSAKKDPSVQIMVDKPAGVNVRGLAPGDYYLEETKTPDGYNTLTKRWPVQITAGATGAVKVVVINQAGTELPSTGGMGTTILYTVGGILVLVAAVLLIARRRTEK